MYEGRIKAMSNQELLELMGKEMKRRGITHLGISGFKLNGKSHGSISVHGTDEEIFCAVVNGLLQICKTAPDIFLAIVMACTEVTERVTREPSPQDAPGTTPTVH